MKTKIVNYLIAGAVAIGAAACTDNYGEINSNPYQPGDLTADDYVVGSVMNNMAGCVVSPDVNTTQFTECLMAGPFCGYYRSEEPTSELPSRQYLVCRLLLGKKT